MIVGLDAPFFVKGDSASVPENDRTPTRRAGRVEAPTSGQRIGLGLIPTAGAETKRLGGMLSLPSPAPKELTTSRPGERKLEVYSDSDLMRVNDDDVSMVMIANSADPNAIRAAMVFGALATSQAVRPSPRDPDDYWPAGLLHGLTRENFRERTLEMLTWHGLDDSLASAWVRDLERELVRYLDVSGRSCARMMITAHDGDTGPTKGAHVDTVSLRLFKAYLGVGLVPIPGDEVPAPPPDTYVPVPRAQLDRYGAIPALATSIQKGTVFPNPLVHSAPLFAAKERRVNVLFDDLRPNGRRD